MAHYQPAPTRFSGSKYELFSLGSLIEFTDYSRASKDDYLMGRSVSGQQGTNVNNGERFQWIHVGAFDDNDRGASRQAKRRGVKRPGFDALLRGIEAGKDFDVPGYGRVGDVLVLWDLSRRERDLAVFVKIRDLCLEHGPYFWLVGGELYDVRNRHDRSSLGLQAQQAESGADAIAEGVERGLRQNAEDGKPHGQCPFGFKRQYDPRTGKPMKQEPDFATFYVTADGTKVERVDTYGRPWSPAGIVAEIFDDVLAMKPLVTIMRDLNERGIPTPRQVFAAMGTTPLGPERWENCQWTQMTIRRILLNRAYVGVRMYKEEPAREEAWDGIIDSELFYAIERHISDPERYTTKAAPKPTKALYLVSSLARCWKCRDVITYQGKRGRQASENYKCHRNCSGIGFDRLNGYVTGAVLWGILTDPVELAAILALDANAPEVLQAKADENRLTTELAKAKARWRRGGLDDDDYEWKRAQLKPQLEAAKARARASELPAELHEFERLARDEMDEATAREAAQKWFDLPLDAKREIIRATIEVFVVPAGKGRWLPTKERVKLFKRTADGPQEMYFGGDDENEPNPRWAHLAKA